MKGGNYMNMKLADARELLNKAEKTTDPVAKKGLCENAMEILDEVMEDDPDEKDIVVVANIKKSFVRSLADQINSMNINNFETTKFFFFNFILKYPKEINELISENPEYNDKVKWLAEQFRSDIE
jgi:hypothetical protein